MYRYQDIGLKKLCRFNLSKLVDLKSDSWPHTHRTTIINYDDQLKWFEGLLAESPTNPRRLVLQGDIAANGEEKYGSVNGATFGIYKILDIDYVNQSAHVGWDVFSEFRGKGLGKQLAVAGTRFCFDVLQLHRLTTEILSTNGVSMSCAIAAGFEVEGTKREAVRKNRQRLDSIVLGVLMHGRK